MYKINVKCVGEVFDNYLEITTPINMEVQDYLKHYVGTSFRKYSDTFDRRNNNILENDYDITLNFADFIVTSLNNSLNGTVEYRNPAMKNQYFAKDIKSKKFGLTKFNISGTACFKITDIPTSTVGKILSDKRIFKGNRSVDDKNADLSIDWLGFNLSDKDKVSRTELEAIKSISAKTWGLRNGFHAQDTDIKEAFEDLNSIEKMYPIFTGVINHMLYTELLRDISKRFKNGVANIKAEEKILKSLFIKNTILLDALRDLGQRGVNLHDSIWSAGFSSLIYGDVPFFKNFKLSHSKGTNDFYKQVLTNLIKIDESYEQSSSERKEEILQQYRGIFSNLINDRFLFADLVELEDMQKVFIFLKTKATQYLKFNYSGPDKNLESMYRVIQPDARNFLLTYGFNINKIESYLNGSIPDYKTVLLSETLPVEAAEPIMMKIAKVNIESMFKELGFENFSIYKVMYGQAIKMAMEVFYPEVDFALKDYVLDKNTLSEIEKFNHANLKYQFEIIGKIANHEVEGLNVIFGAKQEIMNDRYPQHVLSVVGTLVNAMILKELNKDYQATVKNFQSMNNRSLSNQNGDIYNEALFAIKNVIMFFNNKEYIKNEKMIENLKTQVRTQNLKFLTSEENNSAPRVRGKI